VHLAGDKKTVVDRDLGNLTKLSGECLPRVSSEEVRPEPVFAMSWKEQAQRLRKEAHIFYFVLKHPRTRWYAKLLAASTAAYLFSPIQLIPSFIPVIGFLDDFLVLLLGIRLLQRITPPDVFIECRALAEAAHISRKEEIRSVGVLVTSIVIAAVWLFVAVGTSALLAAYIRR